MPKRSEHPFTELAIKAALRKRTSRAKVVRDAAVRVGNAGPGVRGLGLKINARGTAVWQFDQARQPSAGTDHRPITSEVAWRRFRPSRTRDEGGRRH